MQFAKTITFVYYPSEYCFYCFARQNKKIFSNLSMALNLTIYPLNPWSFLFIFFFGSKLFYCAMHPDTIKVEMGKFPMCWQWQLCNCAAICAAMYFRISFSSRQPQKRNSLIGNNYKKMFWICVSCLPDNKKFIPCYSSLLSVLLRCMRNSLPLPINEMFSLQNVF